MIANTPEPPYVAAVFTSTRTELEEGYNEMNELTAKAIQGIDGYLGHESFRDENGFGINVSYWRDMKALKDWKDNTLHQKAQELGKQKWYKSYKLRICTVERNYEFKL